MYFLHAINSDRQTRLLNVLGQFAMILGDKKCKHHHAKNLYLKKRIASGLHLKLVLSSSNAMN